MSSGDVMLTAWSYGLAGVVFSAFSVRLFVLAYARAPRNGASISLLAAVLCSALWAWFSLADLSTDKVTVRFLGAVADVLRYACWYGFVLALLRPPGSERPAAAAVSLRSVAAVLVLVALPMQGLAALGMGLDGDARIVLLSAMSLPVFGIVLVEQLFRNVHEDSRWNAKPLCLGLAGTFLFDLYLYSQGALFGHVDADALSIRGAVHALMAPLLLLTISRRRDWISKLRVSRKAAFHSAALLICGIYLVFMSSVGYYVRIFGGDWGRALQLALTFLALVLLIVLVLSGTVRAKLRVLLGKHFFRYRYDYREEWLRFTRTLSAHSSPQEMGQQVVRGLADMLESPAGGLWTRAGGDAAFSNTARWNLPHRLEAEDSNSAFCQFLVRSGWVINLEEYRDAPQRYEGLVLPAWLLATPQAWLIVPLRVGDELTGFVVLASARTPMNVNWEVNDLLKTAGRQAASFLAQMQATEALLEVRKFDAFNRMSAFVVHDLKNIVTQLSLMMKNAKRLHANPEFQQDMLMTVENSLDRMRQLMLQLREGATPPGTAFGVDLASVVQRIASVAAGRGRLLEFQPAERITTRGHEERLERVIGHIVQNAFDATEASGRVWVKLDRLGSQARIEVGDTGHGMSKEFVRDRLFKPFQTTKQTGMGIGAYESFQYVQELGGTIQAHSEPDHGTRVVVLLPLFEAQNESDLHMLKAS
jgi:putative PEP-CTERM system histidine kinase